MDFDDIGNGWTTKPAQQQNSPTYDQEQRGAPQPQPQQQPNNGFPKPTYNVDQNQQNNGNGNNGGYQQQQQQQQSQPNNYQQNNYQGQQGGQDGNNYAARKYPPNNGGNGGYQNNNGGQKPQYQNNGNKYQNNNGAYRGGGGGGGGFKPREVDPNPTLYLPYAVAGNDNPPQHVVEILRSVIAELESLGYTMRCGGMKGIEEIAENSCSKKEIHLPWKDFDNKQSKFTFTPPEAKTIAGKYQPGYDGLKPVIQTFLAKNVRVLMGKELKGPALFLITWSEDGAVSSRHRTAKTGNAGHSIAIASHLCIPIFNLGSQESVERMRQYVGQLKQHHSSQEPQNHG